MVILAAMSWVVNKPEAPPKRLFSTTYKVSIGGTLNSSYTLQPGDSLLLERGAQFNLTATLNVSGNGTSGSGAYFGAYGTGPKPIITTRMPLPNSTGAGNTGRWVQYHGDTVWRYIFTSGLQQVNHRLWLDKKEAIHAYMDYNGGRIVDSVNQFQKYSTAYNLSDTLLLYAPGVNPAMFYNSIEYDGETGSTLDLSGNYITMENIDVQGGNVANTRVITCSNVTVKNCTIGRSAGHTGLYFKNARNVTARYNEIESGDSIKHTFLYQQGVGDGVLVDMGSHSLNIWNNFVHDWGHSNFEILLLNKPASVDTTYYKNGLLVSDINYEYNLSKAPRVDYCRHLALDVDTSWANRFVEYNGIRVRYNFMDSAHCVSQLGCRGAIFAFNVVVNTMNPTNTAYQATDAAFAISFSAYNRTSPKDMLIYGNTIAYNESGGLKFQGNADPSYDTIARNKIVNNIIAYNGSKGDRETSLNHANNVQIMVEDYGNAATASSKRLTHDFKNNLVVSSVPNNTFFSNIYSIGNYLKSYTYFTTTGATDLGWTMSGNVTGDPLFTNASSANYTLQTSSPAKGAGLTLASPYDVALNVNSVWPNSVSTATQATLFNMGAFTSGAVTPTLFIIKRKVRNQ